MALSFSFTSSRPSRQTLEIYKRRMELMGMGNMINGPTTVEELKDLVGDRWRKPHKACDEVYPKVFVGGEKAARDTELLKSLGITHIMNVACTDVVITDMFYRQKSFKCTICGIPADDVFTCNIKPFFEESNRFVEVAIRTGGKVLIHCREGISRAPTFAMAYLMMRKNMSALEAVKAVRSKRMVFPNDGFLRQLVEMDERLRKEREI
ncbi:unnamed protein product [Orchesella dallaii]|uniref:Protein-serine/threonine phosphatase n=1 Tax=Orchesella dallaii TaxID=48710 RepID=A0ABP1QLR8_9HEXA